MIHLLRNFFRYGACQDWDKIAKALKPVYTAPTAEAAEERFLGVHRVLGHEVPSDREAVVGRLGRVRPVPRLRCGDPQGDLLNECDRVRQRPDPQGRPGPRPRPDRDRRSQMRLHALMSLDPTGKGRQRWTMRRKAPLNAF